jgi:hypothetical protein
MVIAAPLSGTGPAILLLIMLFSAGCSVPDSKSPKSWQTCESENFKFFAEFPGKVTVDEAGTIAQYQASSDDADFRITCSTVPLLKGKEAAFRELRTMRDGAAKSLNASIEEARNTEVQGQPAIEFTLSFSIDGRNMVSHSRYIRFPECIYQQIVTAPAGMNVKKDVRRFWDSFQVGTK